MKTLTIIASLFILAGCTHSDKKNEQEDIQLTTLMPPAMKQNNNYLKIDSALLTSFKDPVCNMKIKNRVVDTATYDHKLYGFCGKGCKVDFLKEPQAYVKHAESSSKPLH